MTKYDKLRELLIEISGVETVYFQPPESIKLTYPCIVFTGESYDTRHADNHIYKFKERFQVKFIDYDCESEIPEKLLTSLPLCRFDRSYTTNNLKHSVFTIYY